MRLLLAIVVWVGCAFAGVAVANVATGPVTKALNQHAASSASGSVSPSITPPKPPFNPTAVTASSRRSLFAPANFRRALAVAKSHLGPNARMESIEIYPGQLELRVAQHGRESDLSVFANDQFNSDANPTPLTPPVTSYSLSRVSVTAPGTLIARLRAAIHLRPSQIIYVGVHIDPGTHSSYYAVYTKQLTYWYRAYSAHGTIERFGGAQPAFIR